MVLGLVFINALGTVLVQTSFHFFFHFHVFPNHRCYQDQLFLKNFSKFKRGLTARFLISSSRHAKLITENASLALI